MGDPVYISVPQKASVFDTYALWVWAFNRYGDNVYVVVPNAQYARYVRFVWPDSRIKLQTDVNIKETPGAVISLKKAYVKSGVWDPTHLTLRVYLKRQLKDLEKILDINSTTFGVLRFDPTPVKSKKGGDLIITAETIISDLESVNNPVAPLLKLYYGYQLNFDEITTVNRWLFYKQYIQNMAWTSSDSVRDLFVAYVLGVMKGTTSNVSLKKENLYLVFAKQLPPLRAYHEVVVSWDRVLGKELIIEDKTPQGQQNTQTTAKPNLKNLDTQPQAEDKDLKSASVVSVKEDLQLSASIEEKQQGTRGQESKSSEVQEGAPPQSVNGFGKTTLEASLNRKGDQSNMGTDEPSRKGRQGSRKTPPTKIVPPSEPVEPQLQEYMKMLDSVTQDVESSSNISLYTEGKKVSQKDKTGENEDTVSVQPSVESADSIGDKTTTGTKVQTDGSDPIEEIIKSI